MKVTAFYHKARSVTKNAWHKIRARESATPDTQFYAHNAQQKYSFATQFLPKHGQLVDAACGTGFGIARSGAAERFVGFDKNSSAIRIGEEQNPQLRGKLKVGNVLQMPFTNHSISGLTAFEMFEHLTMVQKRKFLDEVKRVLAPNGVFVMSTPLTFGPVRTLNIHHFGKEPTFETVDEGLRNHFSNVKYFGMGVIPKNLSGRLSLRALELIASIDVLYLRRLAVSSEKRSRTFARMLQSNSILPMEEYAANGNLPKTLIAIAK